MSETVVCMVCDEVPATRKCYREIETTEGHGLGALKVYACDVCAPKVEGAPAQVVEI